MCKDRQRRIVTYLVLLCVIAVCGTAWALFDGINWPEASGQMVDTSSKLTIDYSHIDLGYVMVHGPQSSKSVKLQVSKDGYGLNYDINGNGNWEIIPLQFGEGNYKFAMFEHASGTKFTPVGQLQLTAQFSNPASVYLIPSQYVYYVKETPAVAKSDEICAGLSSDQEKFDAIRAYIRDNYVYDFDKAKSVSTGLLPSVDYVWDKGMGICQDLAALAACMLRVQGIPTQLMIGYVDGNYYHAWNYVYINGQPVQYDPTADVSDIPLNSTYQPERFY